MRTLYRCAAVLSLIALAGCGSNRDLNRSSTQLRIGTDAARQDLWREALFRFRRAVELDPGSAMAHNNLAVAYEGTGEFEKARAEYGEALRIAKSNPYIQKNYSRFVEFTTRNTRRERKLEPGGAAAPSAATPAPPVTTPAPPPEAGGSQPVSPPAQPEPPPPVPEAPSKDAPPPGDPVPPSGGVL